MVFTAYKVITARPEVSASAADVENTPLRLPFDVCRSPAGERRMTVVHAAQHHSAQETVRPAGMLQQRIDEVPFFHDSVHSFGEYPVRKECATVKLRMFPL